MTIAGGRAYSCAVLTVSDKGARGEREDTSGPNLAVLLTAHGFRPQARRIVADEAAAIQETLIEWADRDQVALIVTTGGTGVSPRDVTPEATRGILDREIPGIGEAMRLKSLAVTPHAMLSRGIAGIRGRTLIINLPGSRKGAQENLEAVLAALPHALGKIQGGDEDCG